MTAKNTQENEADAGSGRHGQDRPPDAGAAERGRAADKGRLAGGQPSVRLAGSSHVGACTRWRGIGVHLLLPCRSNRHDRGLHRAAQQRAHQRRAGRQRRRRALAPLRRELDGRQPRADDRLSGRGDAAARRNPRRLTQAANQLPIRSSEARQVSLVEANSHDRPRDERSSSRLGHLLDALVRLGGRCRSQVVTHAGPDFLYLGRGRLGRFPTVIDRSHDARPVVAPRGVGSVYTGNRRYFGRDGVNLRLHLGDPGRIALETRDSGVHRDGLLGSAGGAVCHVRSGGVLDRPDTSPGPGGVAAVGDVDGSRGGRAGGVSSTVRGRPGSVGTSTGRGRGRRSRPSQRPGESITRPSLTSIAATNSPCRIRARPTIDSSDGVSAPVSSGGPDTSAAANARATTPEAASSAPVAVAFAVSPVARVTIRSTSVSV